jgi:hypothetical protein
MEVVIEKLKSYEGYLLRPPFRKTMKMPGQPYDAISLENNHLLNPDTVMERIAQLMTEPWFQKTISISKRASHLQRK